MRSGGCPAGSSRQERLDPFALPVAFATSDAAAGVRVVEVHRERVVMRRSLAGMVMAINMPVAAYDGIALRLVRGRPGAAATVEVSLEHKDPGLTLPLYASDHGDDAIAEWQSWSKVLGLPMLFADESQTCTAGAYLGAVRVSKVRPRRRRHSSLRRRRPMFLTRRKAGRAVDTMAIHRGEHEIIARN
ncbi:DUF6101 family protein [Undibacter mobilis]|uniref:Uncharacterized protein n=1 Tax=Undibacter mobilis TaxID=2292256 RepID=A0A371BBF2_9BRAD|nr:DUF6101 family protein [Undibacter mobilis]RDV04945.1 hypothetical protein DXH78_10450 [Undibacter mobilis]